MITAAHTAIVQLISRFANEYQNGSRLTGNLLFDACKGFLFHLSETKDYNDIYLDAINK